MLSRFSVLRRSGSQVFAGEPSQVVKPLRQTSEEGLPVLPPGGVTPPDPEKYGTFAARWLYSQRKVMYWLGIQSNVPDRSQALYGSPGFSVKYGVPEVAVAPLIGGSKTKYRPGLLICPPPIVRPYCLDRTRGDCRSCNPERSAWDPSQ